MRTYLAAFLMCLGVWAADPQQPKVGNTPVINATNGYAGTLTVRTQINLGLSGVEGTLLVDTNGTIQATSVATGTNAAFSFITDKPWLNIESQGQVIGADTDALNAIIGAAEGVKFGYVSDLNLPGRTAPWGIFVGSVLDANARVGTWVSIDSPSTNATAMELGWYGPVYNNTINYTASATSGSTLDIESGGVTAVRFAPTIVDGQTPYLLDTSVAHTSGNLAEFRNDGTLKDALAAGSLYSTTGQRYKTDDGTYHIATFAGPVGASSFTFQNLAATTTDLYTVPATNRAVFTLFCITTNASPGTVAPQIKLSGSYYYLNTAVTPLTTTATTVMGGATFVAEPGDTLAVLTTTAGVTIFGEATLFPTNSAFKSPRMALASGDNTLYTCPASMMALGNSSQINGVTTLFVVVSQASGGSLSYIRKLNGVTFVTANVSDKNATSINTPPLNEGDVFVVNSPSTNTTQFAWITLYELNKP